MARGKNIPGGKRMWTHVLLGFKAPPPPHFLNFMFRFYGFTELLLPYLARGRSKWKRKEENWKKEKKTKPTSEAIGTRLKGKQGKRKLKQ